MVEVHFRSHIPPPSTCGLGTHGGSPSYSSESVNPEAVQGDVDNMLGKGALEEVKNPGSGYYSRLVLVQKASDSWKPVIDLSTLNNYVTLTPFKMEMVSLALRSIRKEDVTFSMDLKSAHF